MDFVSKRNLYTLAFFLETLSTGFNVHLIKGDAFDQPNEREQQVAFIVSRLWLRLSVIGRVDRILTVISAATAERYIRSKVNSTERKYIFLYHYDKVEETIKVGDSKLYELYVEERRKLQHLKMPPLKSGTIDLRNVKTILRRAQVEYLTNDKLRKMLVNLIFANRAFAEADEKANRTNNNDDNKNALLARAVLLLSARSEIAEQVQYRYDQTLELVLETEARNPRGFDGHVALEELLFRTLSHIFENDLKLNRELVLAKQSLLKNIR
jgi:hypothetical protein